MRLHLLTLVSILAAGTSSLLAAPFTPYSHVGSVAPTVTTYATGTSVDAYFYSSSAADTDTISAFDVTTGLYLTSINSLNNHTSFGSGIPVVFSGANVGDQIAFDLTNQVYGSGSVFSSDPLLSTDGDDHAYITNFSGLIDNSQTDVTGLYIGMEDLPAGSSDFDYNDDTFIATGLSTTPPVPEPSSIVLLGTGLFAAAGIVRRKFAC